MLSPITASKVERFCAEVLSQNGSILHTYHMYVQVCSVQCVHRLRSRHRHTCRLYSVCYVNAYAKACISTVHRVDGLV